MTDEERREMMRNNYTAQMEMLGYEPDGNPKDMVEVVRCKDCKKCDLPEEEPYENGYCSRCGYVTMDWFCADGERR